MKNKILLKKHLLNLGFNFFDNKESYISWAELSINNSDIPKSLIKKYYSLLNKNLKINNFILDERFYKLIEEYDLLSSITHSMKSQDILASGYIISDYLFNNALILDVGCNSGYLTSFYSTLYKDSFFIGLDVVTACINKAKVNFKSKKYPNLLFLSDIESITKKNFNLITDTQCLCNLKKITLNKLLNKFKNLLSEQGKIISISNLKNEQEAKIFIKTLNRNGFFVEHISDLFVKNIYGIQAYTKLIINKNNKKADINVDNYFKKIKNKISILEVSKLL